MAVDNNQSTHPPEQRREYSRCLITPMGRDGDPLVRLTHIIDALLVGALVFFAVILGNVIPSLLAGDVAYLTVEEIVRRTPTGLIAFGLTFVFQWLRARGIDVMEAYTRFKEGLP